MSMLLNTTRVNLLTKKKIQTVGTLLSDHLISTFCKDLSGVRPFQLFLFNLVQLGQPSFIAFLKFEHNFTRAMVNVNFPWYSFIQFEPELASIEVTQQTP